MHHVVFESGESVFLGVCPFEGIGFSKEFCERFGFLGIVGDEFLVESCKSEESANVLGGGWCEPVVYELQFFWHGSNAIASDNVAAKFYFRLCETTFGAFGVELLLLKAFE